MSSWLDSVRRFHVSEDGPTAAEYAVMLAIVTVALLVGVKFMGTKTNTQYGTSNDMLNKVNPS